MEQIMDVTGELDKLNREERAVRAKLIEDTITGGLMSGYDEPGFPFYFVGKELLNYLGYESEEAFVEDIGGLISNCMHPDDVPGVEREVREQLQKYPRYEIEYRMRKADGRYIWVKDYGRKSTLANGREVINSVVYDIDEQKHTGEKEQEYYRQLDQMQNALIETQASMQAAIAAAKINFFEYYPEGDYALERNGREIFGLEERLENYPENWFERKITHPDDEAKLRDCFMKMKNGQDQSCCTVRNMVGEEYHWYFYNLSSIYDVRGRRSKVVCTAQDIEESKRAQETNEQYKRLYERNPGWIFTCKNDEAWTLIHTNQRIEEIVGYTVEEFAREKNNSIASVIPQEEKLFIRKTLRQMQERGFGTSATFDTPIFHKKGIKTWVKIDVYWDEKDGEGYFYASCSDITELKKKQREAALRLEEEKRYQQSMDSEDILLKTYCNVTKNTVDRLETKPEMTVADQADTFTGGVFQLIDAAFGLEDKRLIERELSKTRIEESVKDGGMYSFEYRRKDRKQHIFWVRVTVRALIHPETQDVIAFISIRDINAQKKISMIMQRIAEVDFEVLALVYVETNDIECIRITAADDPLFMDFNMPYNEGIRTFIREHAEKSGEEFQELFQIPYLQKALEKDKVFEVSGGICGEQHRRKKWAFTYLDNTKTTIIFKRTDITELFKKQEQQNELLSNALLEAEEASKAKTNFLSRMSHEIRTPMNAIIGMNTLAAQSVDKPDQVADCLSKIGISSRFLLSLINDILDMSRIESGKVSIKNNKFPLDELVNNINAIFYEQADKKGIDYECIISSFTYDYYIGDSMKIQQVIVNLLGNSIKFTEPGGKVQLMVNQERVEHGRAYMTFTVNDTGIGISEELQQRMFEPFEQGDTTSTTPYKGTGLGLAIARNLVSMMNGLISVNSIEGVGTEFMVRLPLDICEEEQRYLDLKLDVLLEKLNTLIVDDDVTICEHTHRILLDMGMKAEWVESGRRAVERIRSKWQSGEYFDVVLLDWKMPDMDGVQTAREIRSIVGKDVTIIVMTAYDWAEIEQEARQAGVNFFVAKPLFKSSIVSVYEHAFKVKKQQKAEQQATSYDFTGRRVLLVEDHILNVEVAKRLMEAKHAEVTVADNGLHSIEKFMEAPEGYFDAILMDICMPVMDGLTATRSIRQLHKRYASNIPIIAMSANAFEEDVEKSKAAGMNEHLSKPIEPHILYAALQKWFERDRTE
ncbi:MAG: response regulator [Lachnospiraceae bacterium]|nr:response regulator [Lachnospiraceae bacterium]